jgi:hypothetical protein
MTISRGGSWCGGERSEISQPGADGWAVAGSSSGPPRPPTKAGDLSYFGKINKSSTPVTFGPEIPTEPSMSGKKAMKKISEDSKEFFAVRNLDEAEEYFSNLPVKHRFRLVEKLVATAIESKESDAQLVAEFFGRSAEKGLCSTESFEEGFTTTAEILDEIVVDAPKAFELMAIMLKGAGLDNDERRRSRIASKSKDSDKLLSMLRGCEHSEISPPGADGWAVAGSGGGSSRSPTKAGDLSHFGKIDKSSTPVTFGPRSVSVGKTDDIKKESSSLSSSSSSLNMFSMLQNSDAVSTLTS